MKLPAAPGHPPGFISRLIRQALPKAAASDAPLAGPQRRLPAVPHRHWAHCCVCRFLERDIANRPLQCSVQLALTVRRCCSSQVLHWSESPEEEQEAGDAAGGPVGKQTALESVAEDNGEPPAATELKKSR